MAGLKIQGNLDGIHKIQLGYIKDVIKKLGFVDANVVIDPVGQAGDNYVAEVKRITMQDKDGGTLKMIAKIAPYEEVTRAMMNTGIMFKNEHTMYTKVLPKFEQVQITAGIPKEGRYKFAACYGSFNEAPYEVILLEDLKEAGYEMLDRFKPIRDECVRSVLKNFALLHSFSYAIKNNEPALFHEIKNELTDMWTEITGREEMEKYFAQIQASAMSVLESDMHKKVTSDSLFNTMASAGKLMKVERESQYAIIQQGDSWTNNIMFKVEEGKVLSSIMIDYQLSRASSPVADLQYMIFNCTDYKSRKEHFHDWIDYYYTELNKCLSEFELKVNCVYPRDQLDADMKRYGKISLVLSIMLAQMLVLKPEDASRMKEAMASADMDEFAKNSNIDLLGTDSIALFKGRLEGLIDSFVELGFVSV